MSAVNREQAGWRWLESMVTALCDEHPSDLAYSADQMVDAFIAGFTEARASAGGGWIARDIKDAEHALKQAKRNYLKRWGWQETCATPGSYWLWRRDWSADDEVAVKRWHEREEQRAREVAEHGHAITPNGRMAPLPYGIVMVPMDLAISMTLSVLDERSEDGELDD